MSYILDVLRDGPISLYALNANSNMTSYVTEATGWNTPTVATPIGPTPWIAHPPLFRGGGSIYSFRESKITLPPAPLKPKSTIPHFAHEVWFRVVESSPTPQNLTVIAPSETGLSVADTVVSFSVQYSDGSLNTVSHDFQQQQRIHAVGVYTGRSNQLYVNGELVAESEVSPEQSALMAPPTLTETTVGGAAAGSRVAVAGLAVYDKELSSEQVTRHYNSGTNLQLAEEVIASNEGTPISVSIDPETVAVDMWWQTESDWLRGELSATAVMDDALVPSEIDGVSVPSTWTYPFALEPYELDSVSSVILTWEGQGATVRTSIDGETWSDTLSGHALTTVTPLTSMESILLIEISFAGELEEDDSYIDNMNLVMLSSSVQPGTVGRTLTQTNATPLRDHTPLSLHDNWGLRINSGGSLSVSTDLTGEEPPFRTIEVWIKRVGNNPSVSVSGTHYINGLSGSATLPANQWSLLHIVTSSSQTGGFTITGPAQIGYIGLYEEAKTAAEVLKIYNQYSNNTTTRTPPSTVINISAGSDAVKAYAYDWTIVQSG